MSRAQKILDLARREVHTDEGKVTNSDTLRILDIAILPRTGIKADLGISRNNDATSTSSNLPQIQEFTTVDNVQFEVTDHTPESLLHYTENDDVLFKNTAVIINNVNLAELIENAEICLEYLPFEKNEATEGGQGQSYISPARKNSPLGTEAIVNEDDIDSRIDITHNLEQSHQFNENHMSDESDDGRIKPLVPYSDHSDSDDSETDVLQKNKKRKKRFQVKEKAWFAEKNKRRREMGRRYLGRNKRESNKWNYDIQKEPREMKQRCLCKLTKNGIIKCATVSDQERKKIFEQFWNFTWGEKKVFVDNTVKVAPVSRHRDRKDPNVSRRAQSLMYNLKINDSDVRVCRTMYLNTLALGRWTILNWKNSMGIGRAPRSYRVNKVSQAKPFEKETQELHNFVDALPAMESHYCRASSSKKYLLPEWTSKQNLYNLYAKDWCESRNVNPLSISSFNNALNLKNVALFRSKKDECETCSAHKLGHVSENDYHLHISKKNEARLEKQKDSTNEPYVFTVDLQAVLLAPKSNVSSLYYETKLCVHNLCFYNLRSKDAYCYIWNESEGGLTAEEFASCFSYFIENEVLPHIDRNESSKIIMYSDGCTYQNRNAVIANAAINLATMHNITIEQKYLEVGHTQMEADSVHSTIERCLRNRKVNVPADYVHICKIARKKPRPYSVKYLDHVFFKSFKKVNFLKSIRPGKMKGDAKVTDIRAMKYTTTGEVLYKLRFQNPWEILPQRKRAAATCAMNDMDNLYSERIKISAKKFSDLQELKRTLDVETTTNITIIFHTNRL